jgi:hypothetical protein
MSNAQQPRVSNSNFPEKANCQNCGSFFNEAAVRVQYPVAGQPKRWKTYGWFCQSCAHTLGYK